MTATFLQSELSSLIQDSKKKYPDVRNAAENSLNELKALSITSEAQIAGDLRRKPQFVDTFVLACETKNAKLAIGGVVSLQRLTACKAIPRDRLRDVLGAFHNTAALGLDIQLKILQALPSLLQLYAEDLRDELLASTLEVCDILQGSKTQLISSTAAATFQQLITTVFERVAAEDQSGNASAKITVETDNEQIELGPAAFDAFRIFNDLCALVDDGQPSFVHMKNSPAAFTLEVIGSALTNHEATFANHEEQLQICRTTLIPALVRTLEVKASFPLLVRVLRIVKTLLTEHLTELIDPCEVVLTSMIQFLEPNPAQNWTRTLCMEIFREICSDFALIRHLFRVYDQERGRKNVLGDLVAAFVRISSENATLIGLGRQSTTPQSRIGPGTDQAIASYESTGIGGTIGNVASATSESAGISVEWSNLRGSCLDQLDKASLTDLPPTYIYTLILRCLADLADGLSKFVMPLSVPKKEQLQKSTVAGEGVTDADLTDQTNITPMAHKYQRLVNPLRMQKTAQHEELQLCARMIEQYWPAFLATCSTFLNAALDSDYYHTLVRAVQKMTQVAGVLELVTARDALLTCISKAALPATTSSVLLSFRDRASKQNSVAGNPDLGQNGDLKSPQTSTSRPPLDPGRQTMTIRNMLCLRALLNLGIALGPTMSEDAWFILIETLEQAELLAELPQNLPTNTSEDSTIMEESKASLSTEITAMRTASRRMLDSTRGYSNSSFRDLVAALFKLASISDFNAGPETVSRSPIVGSPRGGRMHQASRSMSGMLRMSDSHEVELQFVLAKVSDLARINLHRFVSADAVGVSWDLIVAHLLHLLAANDSSSDTRLRCAGIIDSISAETMKLVDQTHLNGSYADDTYRRCLQSLTKQLKIVTRSNRGADFDGHTTNIEIHTRLLMTTENILGYCGDSFGHQWDTVFELVASVFENAQDYPNSSSVGTASRRPRTLKLLQLAFRTVQLIISDFLNSLSISSTAGLVLLLGPFAAQKQELNISLSTVTFYWSIMVLVQENLQNIDAPSSAKISPSEFAPADVWYVVWTGLLRLCSDEREDIRQSSIRMVLKVLETSSGQMTTGALNSCLRDILSQLLPLENYTKTPGRTALCKFPASAIQLFAGMVDVFVQQAAVVVEKEDFASTWSSFIRVSRGMLEDASLDMSAAVFAGISKMLSSLRDVDRHDSRWAHPIVLLWLDHHPAKVTEKLLPFEADNGERMANISNQEAYLQHANCFPEILNSLDSKGAERVDVDKVMLCLSDTVFTCSHPRYTSDIKSTSPEQNAVLQILPMLHRLMRERQREYMVFLLNLMVVPTQLVDSALSSTTKTPSKQTTTQFPTFVAFRKSCMAIYVQNVLSDEVADRPINGLAIPSAVRSFANIINSKYTNLPQGSDPPLWQTATTAAYEITTFAVNQIRNEPTDTRTDQIEFFAGTIAVATSILGSGGFETLTHPSPDEAFDVQSILTLHSTIIPILGVPSLPISIPKCYILSLFHASLVAKPISFDLPSDLPNHPLQTLPKTRMGTVRAPIFAQRQEISHTALTLLFSLAQKPVNGAMEKEERSALAHIAAPYILLRPAHSFKTFLADQPLRSLEALPPLLRREMIAMLKLCLDLRSDDGAFIRLGKTGADLGSDGRGHVRLLFGLVLQMQDCWRRMPRMVEGNWQDGEGGREIEKLLSQWGRVLGEGWIWT